MIIKACERGGAAKLAKHLLNEQDNEHVEVHEVSGFMSQHLKGAMDEAYAVSRGTQCKKFLFSVILSPPAHENPTEEDYEDAAQRVEDKMKLQGQPRIFVFHEKDGRRHAHVVWSRIDSQQMKAINLPFFKNRLNDIAKSLYLEHGWDMPQGFIDREKRNPLNFSLQEWQQAERLDDDPRMTRAALQACWKQSDSKQAFMKALEQHGYYLARGDRRGFVAVDWRGEVYSLSRLLGQKKKTLLARLGDPADLVSVDEAKAKIEQKLSRQVQQFTQRIKQQFQYRLTPLTTRRNRLKQRHTVERGQLIQSQEERQIKETQARHTRFRKGLRGFWDRITGKYRQIKQLNEAEALAATRRDKKERHQLRSSQLQERRNLQRFILHCRQQQQDALQAMRKAVFSKLPEKDRMHYQQEFERTMPQLKPIRGPEP